MYPSPVLESQEVPPASSQSVSHLQFLRTISERDPFHEMHDQERKIIWSLRYDCLHHVPHLLPKLLDCVEWNDHTEVNYVSKKGEKINDLKERCSLTESTFQNLIGKMEMKHAYLITNKQ